MVEDDIDWPCQQWQQQTDQHTQTETRREPARPEETQQQAQRQRRQFEDNRQAEKNGCLPPVPSQCCRRSQHQQSGKQRVALAIPQTCQRSQKREEHEGRSPAAMPLTRQDIAQEAA